MSKISFNYEKRDGKGPAQGLCVMAGGSGAASSTFSFCSILSARASSFLSSLVLRLAAASGGGDFESDTHTHTQNEKIKCCLMLARTHVSRRSVCNQHTHTPTQQSLKETPSYWCPHCQKWDLSYLTWWSPDFFQPIRDY